jgi:argininosuccinate synthase
MTQSRDRIVLAYSGSAATSAAIKWLAETHEADVIALTLDLDGRELQELHERAMSIGAVRAHVLDVREEFADEHLLPALQAGALHPGTETPESLARPLIARKLLDVAGIERAAAVAHGAAPGSELDGLIRAIDPAVDVIAPVAPGATGGSALTDVAEYARAHNIVVPHAAPRKVPPVTPDHGADVEIAFDRDAAVAINGVPMSLTELIESLSVIAAHHGVDGAGDFRGAPAIAVLQAAFDARRRDQAASVVRVTLRQGVTTAAVVPNAAAASSSPLAGRRS